MRASRVEFFSEDDMVCASPPKLEGLKIAELHPSILPKVKKPVKVKPWLPLIDLHIYHGDKNFTHELNFTTDVNETTEDDVGEFLNVSVPLEEKKEEEDDKRTTVADTVQTTAKPRKKNPMPDVNNRILKSPGSKNKSPGKKTRHKSGYFNDQQKTQKTLTDDPYNAKTRPRGRHRIVETENSSESDEKVSKSPLFAQLLSRETEHTTQNAEGSGGAEPTESFGATAKPGLFYDAYLRTTPADNQNSGEVEDL